MPTDRTTDFLRELLVRQLTTWLPAALHRSRRATVALAGADAGSAEAALRLVATHGDQVRGRQVTVLVLADAPPTCRPDSARSRRNCPPRSPCTCCPATRTGCRSR